MMHKKKYLLAALLLAVSFAVSAHYSQTHSEWQHSETQISEYRSDQRVAESAGLAIASYASSHKGRLPSSHHWEESIKPYWPDKHYTVLLEEHPGDILAMNSKLSGVSLGSISPDSSVVLYESHSQAKNTSGTPPWKQCHQCGPSVKRRLWMVFASGWACSCAEGSAISF